MHRRRGLSLLLPVVAALAWGCAVGPNYQRPDVDVPPLLRGLPAGQGDNAGSASFGDQKWWETFQDATLQLLIRSALERNYDVRIAAVRILEARAQLGITRADQFPWSPPAPSP
ncbi:MAG TPA: hypothetical protein VNG89_08520 [Vicinamibacterales bacterium]|nr:hypothetical protein [Vicinamibacterales bacterium]